MSQLKAVARTNVSSMCKKVVHTQCVIDHQVFKVHV